MTTCETRIMELLVAKKGDPIFAEFTTRVRIEDEAGGEFVVVSQEGTPEYGKIAINPDEWPAMREAIDRMIAECRTNPDDK
jgi:archaeosine-15-forming tRNA-guanine transglycosylase